MGKKKKEESKVSEDKAQEEKEPPAEEEIELENLVENSDQTMSTTFTASTPKSFKPISPTLEAEPIQEPFQNLETELEETEVQEGAEPLAEEEQPAYAETPQHYAEAPTEESAQQLADYQTQGPKESLVYDTQQTMNPMQRFDTSSGVASGMQAEKRQFQTWHDSQMGRSPKAPSETYTVNPQKIDDRKNLPFKKNKKRGPFGF